MIFIKPNGSAQTHAGLTGQPIIAAILTSEDFDDPGLYDNLEFIVKSHMRPAEPYELRRKTLSALRALQRQTPWWKRLLALLRRNYMRQAKKR
ncbi:MAG: hypothetical protein J6E31_00060 [Pyramidobacter sp.]|nr:hypothetical protein [Pyramidobacter sp.]